MPVCLALTTFQFPITRTGSKAGNHDPKLDPQPYRIAALCDKTPADDSEDMRVSNRAARSPASVFESIGHEFDYA